MAGNRFYTVSDCCKGYYAIEMEDESKDYSSFVTHRGQHRWTVMPFGLVNSSASYSRMMLKVLEGATQMSSFVDDVICYTTDFESHVNRVEELFARMRKANVVLKPTKTKLGFTKIEFLGHTISENRMGTASSNV